MPANIVKSPADEKKWTRAKQIVKKQKGRKPKSDRDWGLVTHIFKNMKKGSETEMSNTPYLDAWVASREKTAGRFRDIARGLTGGRGWKGFEEAFGAGSRLRRAPEGIGDLFPKMDLNYRDILESRLQGLPEHVKIKAMEDMLAAPMAGAIGHMAPELAGIGAVGAAGTGLAGLKRMYGDED